MGRSESSYHLFSSKIRDGADSPLITEADVIAGCAMQMRGTLQVFLLVIRKLGDKERKR